MSTLSSGASLAGLPRPAAVVFDFDGVILESAAIKTEAFGELFADDPEHREAILAHHQANLGVSRYAKFEWIYRELLGRELDADERRRLGAAFSELVRARMLACPMVAGAAEALAALGRLPAFVASGTPQGELVEIVERRGLGHHFIEVRGTPPEKPELLRELVAAHSLPAARVLMVGDGLSDHAAATAAGTRFVARQAADAPPVEWPPGTPVIADLRPLARFLDAAA